MISITRDEAYAGFDETDFKVVDYELDSLFNSGARNGREMTFQYFLEDEKTITLKVYWDAEEVATYTFENKGELTETAIKKLQDQEERSEQAQRLFSKVQENAWKEIKEREGFTNGGQTMKIEQKEHDVTYYLNVDSHYHEVKDAKGQPDAVMFEMCQYEGDDKSKYEVDAIITSNVEDARALAKAILKLCDEIEN